MKTRFSCFLLASVLVLTCLAKMVAPPAAAQAQNSSKPNDFLPQVRENPPAPKREPVEISELPLPPTAASSAEGS